MTTIYELVDVTDDERYWTMGLFESLSEVDEAIAGGPEVFGNPHDRDESMVLEVRERSLGWDPWDTGKVVATHAWNLVWPEDDGDTRWEAAKP